MNEQGSPSEATHASTMSQHILVVEDEQALALGIRDALLHAGYEVDVAHDGNTAMEILKQKSFDLVVLDIMLPGRSGLEVLRELRQERHDVRVVVLTALADESDVLAEFLAQTSHDLTALRRAVAGGDDTEAASVVHRIRGASLMIGASGLAHACSGYPGPGADDASRAHALTLIEDEARRIASSASAHAVNG